MCLNIYIYIEKIQSERFVGQFEKFTWIVFNLRFVHSLTHGMRALT